MCGVPQSDGYVCVPGSHKGRLQRIALSVDTWLPKAKLLADPHPQCRYDKLHTIARLVDRVFHIDSGKLDPYDGVTSGP